MTECEPGQPGRPKKAIWLLLVLVGLLGVGAWAVLTGQRAYALDQTNCLVCHGNPDLSKTNAQGQKVSLYVNVQQVDISAHRTIDCTTCHTTDPHKVSTPLNKMSQVESCGTCHQYQKQQYTQSIHGTQLAAGNPDIPACADCHSADGGPHSVIRTLEFTAPTYKNNIAETCGRCHADESLMVNYGIVERVYESYMRSFHGKELELSRGELGQVDVATCTNCHGAHDIKSVTDPASPVAGMDNLLKTCQQCHPGAGPAFVSGFPGHKEASPQHIPVAYYAQIFFTVLLITVLAFGAAVVVMAIVRYSINRWRE